VSLPVKACDGVRILQEQLNVQVELATFVLWDEDGDGVEVAAPASATVEEVLRLARRLPGVEVFIMNGASARVVHAAAAGEDVEVPLHSPVPSKMLFHVQEPRKATALVLKRVQITAGTSREVELRVSAAIELLDDLNHSFGSKEYQAEVRAEQDPRGIQDLILAVHAQVLPRHGLASSEVPAMQSRIGLVLCGSKEVEEKANRLVHLAYASLGPVSEVETNLRASAGTEGSCSAIGVLEAITRTGSAAVLTAVPADGTQARPTVECCSPTVSLDKSFCLATEVEAVKMEVMLVRLATEGSGRRQRLRILVPVGSTIGELRAVFCKAQGLSEEVGRKVRFQMPKGEGRFRRLNDSDEAVPEIFMASVPPLRLPSELEPVPEQGQVASRLPLRAPQVRATPTSSAPGWRNPRTESTQPLCMPTNDFGQCLALLAEGCWDVACVPLCLSLCLSASLGGLSVAASLALSVCSVISVIASAALGLSVVLCSSCSSTVFLIHVAFALFGLPVTSPVRAHHSRASATPASLFRPLVSVIYGKAVEQYASAKVCLHSCLHMCPAMRPFICLCLQL